VKLWGVSMVRNEEDIVEAFVRHNLTVLDGMLVVDHGSADLTLDILQRLCAERLPLVVLRNDAVGYLQAEITTTAARDAFARLGADAVFALDADEFLRVRSRAALERALADVPPRHHAWIPWPAFAPPEGGAFRDAVAMLRSVRRLPTPRGWRAVVAHKVALTRAFADDPRATLTMGNHDVMLGRHQRDSPRMPHVELAPEVVEACHVPVRGAAQFVVKTTVKRLARIAAGRDYPAESGLVATFESLKRGEPRASIAELARRFHRDTDDDEPGASDAGPAAVDEAPFVADVVLRYTPAAPVDPLPLVASAVERLARRLAAARAAASRKAPPGTAGTNAS